MRPFAWPNTKPDAPQYPQAESAGAAVSEVAGERTMSRLASLDYLRGFAALAVAIPHYFMLGSTDWPLAQVISILAVEQFFVLSGFVLAPQMIACLLSPRGGDVGVFLVRRWMRTIPPYLFALGLTALLTANFYAPALVKYVFYIQNLFRPLPDAADFFPVAWSLSVEEWYYVVFAVLVVLARLAGLKLRGFIAIAVCFVLVLTAARLAFADTTAWDAAVRRVVAVRMDSIAYGFLLYCGLDFLRAAFAGTRRLALPLLVFGTGALAFYAGWQATAAKVSFWQQVYPVASGIFALFTILSLVVFRETFQRSKSVAESGYFLGKISYTAYLFHLPLILVLRPHISGLPVASQMAIYLATLISFCAAFYFSFEAPILRARPRYPRGDTMRRGLYLRAAELGKAFVRSCADLPAASRVTSAVSFLVFAAAVAGVERFQQKNILAAYYIALCLAALALTIFLLTSGLRRVALLRVAAATFAAFSLLLPVADALVQFARQRMSSDGVAPVFAFREAQGNPEAFAKWWARYAETWRHTSAAIQAPDPLGKLPFVLKPNARATFFEAPVRINNIGFRGEDIAPDKGNRYRILVMGESPTFGTALRKGETTWVEDLARLVASRLSCDRPIEIVNGGTAAYGIVENIELLRRKFDDLKPDMVVSYHGFNSYRLIDRDLLRAPPAPVFRQRGSFLISQLKYRFRVMAYDAAMRRLHARAPSPYDDVHAQYYRTFVELVRAHGARPVLANLSLAVTAASPGDVVKFYGRVFSPIDRILPAIAEHNRIVASIANETGAQFIDTKPGLAGEWDRNYFIDLVHFTQEGAAKLASNVFAGIAPSLVDANGPVCRMR